MWDHDGDDDGCYDLGKAEVEKLRAKWEQQKMNKQLESIRFVAEQRLPGWSLLFNDVSGFTPTTRYGILDVFWVSMEGPIGAGKTTLMQKIYGSLADRFGMLNVFLLLENIDELLKSGLFQKYQEDPKRWAYLFQTKMFHFRTTEFKQELARIHNCAKELHAPTGVCYGDPTPRRVIIITERSIMSGEAFMNVQRRRGNVDEMEYSSYMEMHEMWKQLYPVHPRLIIYCTPGADTETIVDKCQERIEERDRESEQKLVTKDYNRIVLEEHEKLFGGGAFIVPVIRMDTTANYKSDERVAMTKSTEVMDAITKHWK